MPPNSQHRSEKVQLDTQKSAHLNRFENYQRLKESPANLNKFKNSQITKYRRKPITRCLNHTPILRKVCKTNFLKIKHIIIATKKLSLFLAKIKTITSQAKISRSNTTTPLCSKQHQNIKTITQETTKPDLAGRKKENTNPATSPLIGEQS
jgi:hypothetical protein